ncbi:TonB family protein [Bacteroidetes/Chlorobi group bacterium ChocPot_Mid]|nr:MAG: TonB family protein [Bacteroidetes/Chlorobi group bacterium ChocPot_Mid]
MKKIIALVLFLILNQHISISQINLIDNNPDTDKTLSPYFLVKSNNPDEDQLPLYLTKAEVNIVGVIADVKVTQIYKNNGKNPLEAIYFFPSSTRAAVYAMTMTIGDRILKAEIQERKKAREIYEQAKKEGITTSLLEQQRPNVFQMNVANIMPGDSIIVEMKYTELLVPTDKTYEFVYPTVVGPRYSNISEKNANDNDKFVQTPYKHEGEKPDYKFDIKINLSTGVPLNEVVCKTHKTNISQISGNQALIELDKSQEFSGNKDFILNYKLSGNRIETGLILSENEKEKFFLLMLQPPKKIEPNEILPREYIFILDVSGSMNGFPIDVSKEVVKNLLSELKPNEKFNILLFAGSSEMLFDKSKEANDENLNKALIMLEGIYGMGGTELLPALKKVINYPKEKDFSRTILILTDGYVPVEAEAFDLIKNNLQNSNVFTFGIGNSVNRLLIEGMARAGQGESFIITNKNDAKQQAEKFFNYIKSPIMTNINIDFGKFETYDVEPEKIPDVFADRPIIIFGKWRDVADGTIRVSGMYAKKKFYVDIDILKFGTKVYNDALKYLWARNKITNLNDYASLSQKELYKSQITKLGLNYNLLTDYTSFVAVDYLKRNKNGKIVTVKQTLPLPEGVSDQAVGDANMYMKSAQGSASSPPLSKSQINKLITSGNYMKQLAIMKDIEVEQKIQEIKLSHDPLFNIEDIQNNIIYPEEARKEGIEGKVVIRALIDSQGKPTNIKVIYSDNTILDSAAIQAILKSTFTPATIADKPTSAWVTIPIQFKLNKNSEGLKEEKK